jgi:cellobiose phosphorylase
MVAGKEARRPGVAKNSWLTGTAAWNYHAVTEHILGIKPDYEGLRIDPCIPADWRGYSITRKFRGATYRIHVSNPDRISKGIQSIVVDGVPITGNLVEAISPGKECDVAVVMGAAKRRQTA